MIVFVKALLANAVTLLMRWKMIKFVLGLMAKQTDNKLDDNAIELIDALYNADEQKVRVHLEALANGFGIELSSDKS